MNWVLIAIVAGSVTFQPFDREESCEQARSFITKNARHSATTCVRK